MTASTIKGTALTAQLVTEPRTPGRSTANGAPVRIYNVTQELATTSTDETGDIVLLLALPSSAVVHDIRILTDDLDSGTSLAYDLGLYNGPDKIKDIPVSATLTNYAAFAVLDADCFASAVTIGQAADKGVTMLNHRFESAITLGEINSVGSRLWEVVGMDQDPNKLFVIGLTITTGGGTPVAGTMSVQVFASH
jgi:hypothetical protein